MVVVFLRFAGRWRPISGLVWMALILGWPVLPPGIARPLPARFNASYLVESWTPDEGLPDDSVRSIVQTPDQYLWMATAKGLVRYNGGEFVLLSTRDIPALPNPSVVSLHVDRKGRLWASTSEGFAVFDGRSWRRLGVPEGWTADYGRNYAEGTNGPLYIASFNGRMFRTEGERFEEMPAPPGLEGRGSFGAVDSDGRLWLARTGYFGFWDGSKWAPAPAEIHFGDEPVGLAPAKAGGFWLVTSNVVRRIQNGQPQEEWRLSQPVTPFWRLLEDQQGRLWLPSTVDGLYRIDPGGQVELMQRSEGFPYEGRIRCVWEDHQRSLWIGTGMSGLLRLRPLRARVLGPEDGLPRASVTAVAPEPGTERVFVGTFGDGVWVFDGGNNQVQPLAQATNSLRLVLSLLFDRQRHLWIGYEDGDLQRFDGRQLASFPVAELVGRRITALCEDSQGRLYVAGEQGIAVGDERGFRRVARNLHVSTATPRYLTLLPDRGVALGVIDRLYRLEGDTAIPIPAGVFPTNTYLTSLFLDGRNRLWMGTYESGLHVLEQGRMASLDDRRGWPRGRITCIQEDRSGNLWMGIGSEILRASADHLVQAAQDPRMKVEFAILDSSDGLRRGEIPFGLRTCAAADDQGRLWFATTRGAARIDPTHFAQTNGPSRMVIESISYLPPDAERRSPDGQLDSASRVVLRGPFEDRVTLPAASRRVEIAYALLDYVSSAKQRFQVRRNDETAWTDMGNRRRIYYDDLQPGNHVVEVRGTTGDGQGSPSIAVANLTLVPSFQQTAFFRLGSAGLLLLVTAIMVRRDARLRWQRERERLEERSRLAESQLRLVHILENTTDLVAFATPEHQLQYLNRAGRRLLGLAESADVSALVWPSLLPPWAEKRVLGEGLPAALRTGAWQGETALAHRAGHEIPVSQVIITHRDDQGRVDFVSTIMRDISVARRASTINESLRRLAADLAAPVNYEDMGRILARECHEVFGHDAFYAVIVGEDWTPVMTVIAEDTPVGHRRPLAIHCQIRSFSRPVLEALTREAKLLLNRDRPAEETTSDPFGVADRRSASVLYAAAHWEGKPRAVLSVQSYTAGRYTHDDLVLLQTLADQCGAAIARLGIELALRESEERLRFALEAAHMGGWEWDLHSRHLSCSPEIARFYGLPAGSTTAPLAALASAIDPADAVRIRTEIQRMLAGAADAIEDRHRVVRADGKILWIEGRGRLQRDSEGKPIRLSGIVADITARHEEEGRRRQLEAQLRQAQKMQAIGTLAGGIAHDFNNILTGIVGNAGLLQMELPASHSSAQSLEEILRASKRAKDLVGQILTFSRRNDQKREAVLVWRVVEEALKLLRASLPATIEIQAETTAADGTLLADASQLHQVIMNLSTNAAHAMREHGGRLAIRQELVSVDDAILRRHPNLRTGPHLRLTLSDTGHGMSPETLDQIFDPFFTTKGPGEGTGLGLSVVLGIVQNHDGAIHVRSEPGQGTTCELLFPIMKAAPQPAKNLSETPAEPGRGERVLVVDDERVVVELARRILTRLGYTVTGFTDPVEALEAFRTDPDAFDFVVTDLTMPRMTGLALAKALQAIRPGLPLALATGYGEPKLMKGVEEAGIQWFLPKPFGMEELGKIAATLAELSRKLRVSPRGQDLRSAPRHLGGR